MEGEISWEVWMENGVMLPTVVINRVDGFHSGIEAKDEIIEIKAYAESVGSC